jgi:dipeptidase E
MNVYENASHRACGIVCSTREGLLNRALMNFPLVVVLFGLISLPALASPLPAAQLHTSPNASVLVCGGSMMNGNQFAESTLAAMREHYAGCQRIALVLHASHPAARDQMEDRLQQAFRHLGNMAAESLHRHDEQGQRALLEKADGIFVGGGETFVLLRDLYETGQLDVIRKRVLAGIPYGGSSAGANIAGLLIGTTNDFPVADIPSRNALGVFPAVINPHHPLLSQKADHDARAGKIRTYLSFNPSETVVALANASIARYKAGEVRLVAGTGWIYQQGGSRELVVGESVLELGQAAAAP